MNGKSYEKLVGKRTKAMLLVSCMLLCVVSPMVAIWGDEDSYADTGLEGPITYVSLGDSMVNGFGMTDYYESNGQDNSYGFLVDVDASYPHKLTDYFKGIYGDYGVTHLPLAVSGMRTTELRAMLDSSFPGDNYTDYIFYDSASPIHDVFAKIPDGYTKDINGLRAYMNDSLSAADIVTYQYHYDFGRTLSETMLGLIGAGGSAPPLDFSLFVDEEDLAKIEGLKEQMYDLLAESMASKGIDPAEYESLMGFVESIVEAFAYVVIGYCDNFDANMQMMLELNPDMRIITVDCYNTFVGMDLIYDGKSIPLGELYGLVVDTVNMYTKYFSEYSSCTYHVTIDEYPTLFIDEFRRGTNITNDAKNVLMAALQSQIYVNPLGHTEYDMLNKYTIDPSDSLGTLGWKLITGQLITNHGNLTKFLKHIFNTNEFDWDFFMDPNMDYNAQINALTAKTMRVLIDMSNFHFDPNDMSNVKLDGVGYIMQPGASVVYDEVTGSCTISCNNGTEVFSKNELALLWINFYVMQTNAAMTHLSAEGHAQIFDAVKNRIIERDVLNSDSIHENSLYGMFLEDPLPTYQSTPLKSPSAGTLLNLGDISTGLGGTSTYPTLVADRLGMELSPLALPKDARVDDVNYLIGGTDRHDAYTDELMADYCRIMNKDATEIRLMYQEAVMSSDVIIVSLGLNNMMYVMNQTLNAYMDAPCYPMDPTQFDILTQEMFDDFMKVRGHLDTVVTAIFGDNERIMDLYEKGQTIMESVIYSTLGYVDNYFSMMGEIYRLNPDANIVCMSPYNALDGFYYQKDSINIDVDGIVFAVAELFSSYTEYMLEQCRNTIFVDILDVHTNNMSINVADIDSVDVAMLALSACMLTPEEHIEIAERIPLMPSSESKDMTLMIVGGIAAAAIIGIVAFVFLRRH